LWRRSGEECDHLLHGHALHRKNLTADDVKKGEANAEEESRSFVQENVPDPLLDFRRKCTGEEREEPEQA